jgi:ssDNA-binding Zn-finger/Zn-ribbon topoisomerase 1
MFLTEQPTTNRQCPECGTTQICRAHRDGGFDRILSLVNRYPYYCLQCPTDVRFYRIGRK